MRFEFKIKAYLISRYSGITKKIKETLEIDAKDFNKAIEEIKERIKVYEEYFQLRCYLTEVELKRIKLFRDDVE